MLQQRTNRIQEVSEYRAMLQGGMDNNVDDDMMTGRRSELLTNEPPGVAAVEVVILVSATVTMPGKLCGLLCCRTDTYSSSITLEMYRKERRKEGYLWRRRLYGVEKTRCRWWWWCR